MLRRLITTFALLLLTLPAQASEWALEEWLAEPDVKLVAVEFYADWCAPCKEAAPKWEALRKKYASQGLKLVVVNLSEKAGGGSQCTRLPWNPDESICDPRLSEQLGVTELPEAFVWSWQGNLLVDRGKHVSEIEAIIRRYLDDNPRVSVVATNTKGKADKALQRMVEAKLNESGKLTVVSDGELRRRLRKVRRESYGPDRRDDQRCKLGAEVSPNSILRVERFPGSLSLSLVDANTGCQMAATSVDWDKRRRKKSVHKAVFKLMVRIKRREVAMPSSSVLSDQTALLKTTPQVDPTPKLEEEDPKGGPDQNVEVGAFIQVEAGVFQMGSLRDESGHFSKERPSHPVTLSYPFSLQATEVSQGQWKALMGTAPSKFSSCGKRCPVETVSWWDAVAYTNALSRREGLPECYHLTDCSGRPGDGSYRCTSLGVTAQGGNPTRCTGYRLPTEAEWEYAARAGTTGPRYDELSRMAWYKGNAGSKPHPVGEKQANGWGFYDMLGNVWEWTWDLHNAYSVNPLIDPVGGEGGSRRARRGCSWSNSTRRCRSAHRHFTEPTYTDDNLGFRPARTLFE